MRVQPFIIPARQPQQPFSSFASIVVAQRLSHLQQRIEKQQTFFVAQIADAKTAQKNRFQTRMQSVLAQCGQRFLKRRQNLRVQHIQSRAQDIQRNRVLVRQAFARPTPMPARLNQFRQLNLRARGRGDIVQAFTRCGAFRTFDDLRLAFQIFNRLPAAPHCNRYRAHQRSATVEQNKQLVGRAQFGRDSCDARRTCCSCRDGSFWRKSEKRYQNEENQFMSIIRATLHAL